MARIQKKLIVWMIAQGEGILLPDLWSFTRREARDKAVRSKALPWANLEAKGWTSNKVTITALPNGHHNTEARKD
jgi:hypothetical protein